MAADKKQIVVCGNYGASNLGDDAILGGLIHLIKSTWPHSDITVMSAKPAQTAADFRVQAVLHFPAGVRSFFRFWFTTSGWKTIARMAAADIVLLGGGGLFTDEKPRAVWIWFVQYIWFRIFNKKLICISQSVGPLKSKLARRLTAAVFKRALLVTVRDSQSELLLKSLGVKNIHLMADPAFGIGYDQEKSITRQKQVVLSLRPWINGNSKEISGQVAGMIDYLWEKHRLKTVFIPFQTDLDDDRVSYREVADRLVNPEAMTLKTVQDFSQVLEIISRSELVIGMRLHSIIFSILAVTPFIALSYSQKVKSFLQTINLGEYCLDYESFNLTALEKSFLKTQTNYVSLRNQLESQKLRSTYNFFEHEKLLKELL